MTTKREPHAPMRGDERRRLHMAHSCWEASEYLLRTNPGSAQAVRLASALRQVVDVLYPRLDSSNPRAK